MWKKEKDSRINDKDLKKRKEEQKAKMEEEKKKQRKEDASVVCSTFFCRHMTVHSDTFFFIT